MNDGDIRPLPARGDHNFWRSCGYISSFVYVCDAPPATPIKIGHAGSVGARLRELSCGSPYKLRLLYVIPGGADLERVFHRHLAKSRKHGEWFDGPAVDGFLERVGQMAEAMRAAHDGSSVPPHHRDFVAWAHGPRDSGPVSIRFVDPATLRSAA